MRQGDESVLRFQNEARVNLGDIQVNLREETHLLHDTVERRD